MSRAPLPFRTIRRILLAIATSAFLGGGAAADERRPVTPEEREWRAVGRINQGNGAFCTGALIGPDLVITAAHCLYHPRTGRRLRPGSVHFVAGWAKGEAVAHRLGAAIAQSPVFDPGAAPTPGVMASDLALVRLQSPIPESLVAPLPLAPPQSGEVAAVVVSYSRDRAHLASFERCRATFPVQSHRPALAGCASIEGASGAPLLVKTPGGYAIAAVISGRQGQGASARAVATPLHPELNLLRSMLD